MKIEIEELKKVKLNPDDVLIVKAAKDLTYLDKENSLKKLNNTFPNNKIIMLCDGIVLSVITPAKVELNEDNTEECNYIPLDEMPKYLEILQGLLREQNLIYLEGNEYNLLKRLSLRVADGSYVFTKRQARWLEIIWNRINK
jgi:hypothetical protein